MKQPDSSIYFTGPGVFLDLTASRRVEWQQSNRISWVKQRRHEHEMLEHGGKSDPERCVECQDYKIWLALQNPRTSQRLVAAKEFKLIKREAALSRVYRAKERVEKGIPGAQMEKEQPVAEPRSSGPPLDEPSVSNCVRCSCGATICASTREVALRALKKHERQVHNIKRRSNDSN